MITSIWSGVSPFYILLLPFSWLYGLITALIRLSYRRGWRKVHRFRLPIVVVGNLSVGGNGKTPLVVWLVSKLQQRGWRVGVVSRGYGGRADHYPLVLDDATDSDQCGDEPLLIRQRTGAPVAVAPRRAEAVAALLHTQQLDVVITDDGLQHYALGRNIEWVVINGERRFGNGWWLPAGPMRERADRLRSVQGIIVNGGETNLGEVPMQINASEVVNVLSRERRSLNSLTSVVAMAGIAHPASFFKTLRAGGIKPILEISFADHQVYQQHMLDMLAASHEQLLMTEKDAVKCRAFARANWWYLLVDVQLQANAESVLLAPIEQEILIYQQTSRALRSNCLNN